MNFFFRPENTFLNIAHRGGAGLRPENTIAAFRHGLSVGAHALEGDLHATRDGVVVFSHDATVDRCTEGHGNIKEMTYRELRSLDAGYYFTPDEGATYPYRGRGLQIPSLEEVFSDPGLDRAPMVLEIKQDEPSIIDNVLSLVRTYDMEDRLIIGSFDTFSLNEIREKACRSNIKVITSMSEEEVIVYCMTPLEDMAPGGGYAAPSKVLQVPVTYALDGTEVKVINDLFMAKARSQRLTVHIWTVNEPGQMRWLMGKMNVNAIITDRPDLLDRICRDNAAVK